MYERAKKAVLNKDFHMMTIRVPKEMWFFIKTVADKQYVTQNTLVNNLFNEYKKKNKKLLTKKNNVIE